VGECPPSDRRAAEELPEVRPEQRHQGAASQIQKRQGTQAYSITNAIVSSTILPQKTLIAKYLDGEQSC